MKIFLLISVFLCFKVCCQELFVVSDPASNIPANALGINVMQSLLKKKTGDGYNYHLMPEISYGFSQILMLRASGFVSNRNGMFYFEGASLMAKCRFLSIDNTNSHFRMAAFARYSYNRSDIHQEQLEILGHNSGFESGLIATKLIKKNAINSTLSFERAMDNKPDFIFPTSIGNFATNYSVSIGRLMYPNVYKNYKQTNINLMVEFVGQTINTNGKTFIDIVPAIQFIFYSQARIDIAYRYEIYSSMLRKAPNGIFLIYIIPFLV